MTWLPHKTVATVVERDGRFLMVKEAIAGEVVYNQPAGHLEQNESLIEAAVRETLEETAWRVDVKYFLGLYQYTSPANGLCYIRSCFIADAITKIADRPLDADILEAVWLTADEIRGLGSSLRSPAVTMAVNDYLDGIRYPLSLIKRVTLSTYSRT
ncbi:MAG: NUDIX hydrolase [Pseudohongiellaceae bacterium]